MEKRLKKKGGKREDPGGLREGERAKETSTTHMRKVSKGTLPLCLTN